MAITILARREPFRGLRRFDPSRDLRQVTELISAAFGANLDAEGRAALADMQRLSALGPLVRFILTADPNLRRLLNGYVWIEEGRVVGNMSLQSSLQRWRLDAAPGCRRKHGCYETLQQTGFHGSRRHGPSLSARPVAGPPSAGRSAEGRAGDGPPLGDLAPPLPPLASSGLAFGIRVGQGSYAQPAAVVAAAALRGLPARD